MRQPGKDIFETRQWLTSSATVINWLDEGLVGWAQRQARRVAIAFAIFVFLTDDVQRLSAQTGIADDESQTCREKGHLLREWG